LLDAVDRYDAGERRNDNLGPHQAVLRDGFVHRDPAFLDLVDQPQTIAKVWGLLGWNIYLFHNHIAITPPLPADQPREARSLGFHLDSPRVTLDLGGQRCPLLTLKVAYFLTDLTEPGRGNLWIVPSQHTRSTLERPADGVGNPPGALPVCVAPGTAVFFDRRLWHAASPNWWTEPRKALFYGYGHRWLRPVVDVPVPGDSMEASDPIRRQLLGAKPSGLKGYTFPREEDVPLRAWLREHQPAAAA
jgi:ectoine hydroxylase-related dioxygenase (phytanoyl-CoA dioxygenase family)